MRLPDTCDVTPGSGWSRALGEFAVRRNGDGRRGFGWLAIFRTDSVGGRAAAVRRLPARGGCLERPEPSVSRTRVCGCPVLCGAGFNVMDVLIADDRIENKLISVVERTGKKRKPRGCFKEYTELGISIKAVAIGNVVCLCGTNRDTCGQERLGNYYI